MNIICLEPIGISIKKAESIKEDFLKMGHNFIFFNDRKEDSLSLKQRIKNADIAIISNIPLSEDILKEAKNLKMLSIAFTGLDHIDINYCKNNNIIVKNAANYATKAVAELVLGLVLDLYRNITIMDKATRSLSTRGDFLGRQLYGKTIGIVGTGLIGMETALLMQKMGCNVIAYSKSEKEIAKKHNIVYVSLEELMQNSDIISLHTPLTKQTFHLIDRKLLNLCKKDAILINTSRGNVVDIVALAETLKQGKLYGCALDVYEKEPPLDKDNPLLNCNNCILTPHIGYATKEAFSARIDIVINNIKEFILSSSHSESL
ncbi:MAG: hydroxyacid dehydrogenase [Bacteroidales bacterium]|jgi:D-3-phosphoglycerate dehydrogenase|nr:hydroxyacid dehydrogenase [Bacteroidales bacterium]